MADISQLDPDQLDAAGLDDAGVPAALAPPPETSSSYQSTSSSTDPAMGLGAAQKLLERQAGKNATQAKQEAGNLRDVATAQGAAKEGSAAVDIAANTAAQPVLDEATRIAGEHADLLAKNIQTRQTMVSQLSTLDRTAALMANDKLKDPWASAGTGAKIFGTLAQMFGAFTSGVMGGPNIPAEMIKQHLEQDLAVQKFNIMHGQQGFENQRGILSDMMKVYGDLDLAQAAAYSATTDALKRRLDGIAAQYKNPKIVASVAEAKAALDAGAESSVAKLKQFYTAQQNGLAKAEAELSAKQAAADAAMQRQTQKQGQLAFAEWDGTAKTPKQFNDLSTVYTDTTNLVSQLQQVREMAQKLDWTDPQTQQVLGARLAGMFAVMRKPAFEGTGANLSEGEIKNIEKQLPGLLKANVMPASFDALLKDLAIRQSERTMNSFVRNGFRPNDQNALTQQYQALHSDDAPAEGAQ